MSIAHFTASYKSRAIALGGVVHRQVFITVLLLVCTLSGCEDSAPPAHPILTNCMLPMLTPDLSLGFGKDSFEPTETLEQALIVGGYQGGHHLWGALKLSENLDTDSSGRLHMIICFGDAIIAEALYGSVDGLLSADSALYGIPIVFGPHVDVLSLEGLTVQVVAGIETTQGVAYAGADVALTCCGHVADGD